MLACAGSRHPRRAASKRQTAGTRNPIVMVLSLTCAVQNYDWGIKGGCEVSSLGELNTGAPSDPQAVAELWIGAHPRASSCPPPGKGSRDPRRIRPRTSARRPSSASAMTSVPHQGPLVARRSIQAHPDKTLAEQLRADRPNVYKDANHKPEMTLAVTEFEALCGFVAGDVLAANSSPSPS